MSRREYRRVPPALRAGSSRPFPLVDPQRLRVQPGQLRGHRDAEQAPVQVRPPGAHHGRPRLAARYRSASSASTASLMSSSSQPPARQVPWRGLSTRTGPARSGGPGTPASGVMPPGPPGPAPAVPAPGPARPEPGQPAAARGPGRGRRRRGGPGRRAPARPRPGRGTGPARPRRPAGHRDARPGPGAARPETGHRRYPAPVLTARAAPVTASAAGGRGCLRRGIRVRSTDRDQCDGPLEGVRDSAFSR